MTYGVRFVDGQVLAKTSSTGGWQSATTGSQLRGGYVVRAVSHGAEPWIALEQTSESSGRIVFVDTDNQVTLVKKVLGQVGVHSDPPPVVQYPESFWDRLRIAPDDFLGEQYLARKSAEGEDPRFCEVQQLFPPILYPETTVGMNSFVHTVAVGANGSVELNLGLICDIELTTMNYCQHMQFLLNGRRPSQLECETTINRKLLGGWLPATDYRYRSLDSPVGWEQSVMLGRFQGQPGLFVRFILANLDDVPQAVSFAAEPPPGGRFEETVDGWQVLAPQVAGGIDWARFNGDPERTRAFADMQASSPRAVPLSVSSPPVLEGGNLTWRWELPAKGSQELHLFYPGSHENGLPRVPDADVSFAFYAALKEQYEDWSEYLASAAEITIPEPGLEDIFRATLCRVLTAAHGDKFDGGTHFYRGFWQFTHLHAARLMVDSGLFDKARRALEYFLDERVLPDGTMKFDWDDSVQISCFQIFDIGEFLQAVSKYFLATQDPSLIVDWQPQITSMLTLLRENRQRSLDQFPADDPRHGLLTGTFNNDVPEESQYYSNDIPVWFGLRDYAEALNIVAGTEVGSGLISEAREIRAFADEFHQTLRASFDAAGIMKDSDGNPITFLCAPDLTDEGLDSKYFADDYWNSYRRFHELPRMMSHSFASDDETRIFLDYQANHDQTILGVRRFYPEILDDFHAFDMDYQQLRLGRVREFQMKYFAYLQTLTAPGVWTGYEETWYRPSTGMRSRDVMPWGHLKLGDPLPVEIATWHDRNRGVGAGKGTEPPAEHDYLVNEINGFEGLHATIVTPMLTKQMFCFDEPTQDAVWLAAGISTHWLRDGVPLEAKRLGSRYGLIDLSVTWQESTRALVVEIGPQPGRTMTEIRVRLRAPGDAELVSLSTSDGTEVERTGDLAVLRNLSHPVSVRATFAAVSAS